MDEVNEEGGFNNTTIAYTTLNPLGIFSDKMDDVEDLEDGATVAIPNDVPMRAERYYCYKKQT